MYSYKSFNKTSRTFNAIREEVKKENVDQLIGDIHDAGTISVGHNKLITNFLTIGTKQMY